MPLSIRSRLGPYETLSPIGAGGMGEVYRARDTKLGRDVAIKVLPEAFARDARKILEDAKANWKSDGATSFWIAAVHASLGEKDVAFEWLETAFQEHASFLITLKTNNYFPGLHDDPRFDDLVKRIGIPD